MDYKKTLNITLNDRDPGAMPQRANLPAREPEVQSYWDRIGLYGLSLKKDAPKGTFILHDGPPYSNGNIHLGHALNKIAKDIIVKYKTMEGYKSPYVPGWDNHGMPIENEVSREFRKKGEKPDKVTMRKRCREYAASFVESQKAQFRRLGVRGDWDNPYLTMAPHFEATIVEVFGELAEKGFIYRGLKPVLWCGTCETALADAEVEYAEHTSNSIYVRFPVHRDPNQLFGGAAEDPENAYIVIWTTTPWTIPANLALAVHPDASYVVVEAGGAKYLVAEPLARRVLEVVDEDAAAKWGEEGSDLGRLPVVSRVRGEELEGVVAWHPLFKRTSPVVTAPYVTMEDGTGIVHTAPGHGKEDFETGQKHGLEVLNPVGPDGRFTKQADGEPSYGFEGARIIGGEADNRVLEALRAAGALLLHQPFKHQYPHCWRCNSPLIFRATVQWFMNIDHDGHREKSLEAIQQTRWYPPVSINRISSMVAGRPDWCLSRQRAWGVGIPAFYCRDCGREILSREAIHAVAEKVAAESSDAWYTLSAQEILPAGFACPHCGGTAFDKETDILDVWFDSGSTNRAVLENQAKWPNLRWPADVYLEGSDQHRGWFNSSLMVSVATKGRAPYDAVITNGWTLDENGRAMHKSWGNAVSPQDVIQKSGADILRLWVASVDYFEDMKCGDSVIDSVAETYRRIRNTFRFLVNNLYIGTAERRFDPAKDGVSDEEMLDLDRWALAQLDRVVGLCRQGYDAYEFHRIFHAVNNFCAVELSAFYLDVIKDRLYCSGADSIERRSALTALHAIAETLARLLAPILSHTAEEVWGLLNRPGGAPSPQLAEFPQPAGPRFAGVLERWEPVMAARERVNMAVEAARQEKTIGNPLEARVEVTADPRTYAALDPLASVLPVVFKVSQVALRNGASAAVEAIVSPASGAKCARCWLMKEDVGADESQPELCARCASVVNSLPISRMPPEG
jgi:isoleucyl-tRNA synthetase